MRVAAGPGHDATGTPGPLAELACSLASRFGAAVVRNDALCIEMFDGWRWREHRPAAVASTPVGHFIVELGQEAATMIGFGMTAIAADALGWGALTIDAGAEASAPLADVDDGRSPEDALTADHGRSITARVALASGARPSAASTASSLLKGAGC